MLETWASSSGAIFKFEKAIHARSCQKFKNGGIEEIRLPHFSDDKDQMFNLGSKGNWCKQLYQMQLYMYG